VTVFADSDDIRAYIQAPLQNGYQTGCTCPPDRIHDERGQEMADHIRDCIELLDGQEMAGHIRDCIELLYGVDIDRYPAFLQDMYCTLGKTGTVRPTIGYLYGGRQVVSDEVPDSACWKDRVEHHTANMVERGLYSDCI
jgi:hypothetical protein